MADDAPANVPADPAGAPVGGMAPAPAALTAGGLLRQAREARGLHIGALAASLKIAQRKLEALERDRHEELPDAAFVRALAITVCRALKTDPAPVLALLPRAEGGSLDQVSAGLNTPFRDHDAGQGGPLLPAVLRHPAALVVLVLLVAALALWLWPRNLTETSGTEATIVLPTVIDALPPGVLPAASDPPATDTAASDAGAGDAVPMSPSEPASAASGEQAAAPVQSPPSAVSPTASETVQASGADLLAITVREETWLQVVDGTDRILVSRTVPAGDTVTADGVLPLQVIIGNAGATDVRFRGQAVDLASATTGNVARLRLK